jgi:NAD(P)-dependent dehydrogenase (short-subunit alcohol dehydrogenase family)
MTTKRKIALVTGGSRGLGRDMATRLAEKGNDVIITYNSNKAEADKVIVDLTAKGVNATAFQLDVSSVASIDNLVSSVSAYLQEMNGSAHLDYVVNNAGVGNYAPITQTSEAALDSMYAVHLKAPFMLTQKLYENINEGGAVVNISSGLTRFAYDGYAAYAIMKGAVETMSSYMAKEFGAKKIRVNTVAPGAIETDFGGGAVRDNKDLNVSGGVHI